MALSAFPMWLAAIHSDAVETAHPNMIVGTNKGNTLKGTGQSELIYGDQLVDDYITWDFSNISRQAASAYTYGDDTIYAGGGSDIAIGGFGTDKLYGEKGNDILFAEVEAHATDDNGDPFENQGFGGETDYLYGGAGNDYLYDGAQNVSLDSWSYNTDTGDDAFYGGSGADHIFSDNGNDLLFGEAGQDYLRSTYGGARLYGGVGNDELHGGTQAYAGEVTILDGGKGADKMYGYAGDDIYYVDQRRDQVIEASEVYMENYYNPAFETNTSYDQVYAAVNYTLTANVEDLILTGRAKRGQGNELDNTITGTDKSNILTGLGGDDILYGANGNDKLRGGTGNDTLNGGQGNDHLMGGLGVDTYTGGMGADVFDFNTVVDSTPLERDTITDFEGAGVKGGDRIDLSGIDANTTKGGNQAFTFGDATGAGRLWAVDVDGDTEIRGNTDTDADFEFALRIEDGAILASLYNSDNFVL